MFPRGGLILRARSDLGLFVLALPLSYAATCWRRVDSNHQPGILREPIVFGPLKRRMGKGRRGKLLAEAALPIELLPRPMEQIGFEPITRDNPQLRPIKKNADKMTDMELPGVLALHHPRRSDGVESNHFHRVHENPCPAARKRENDG